MKNMNILKTGSLVLGLAVLTSCGDAFLDTTDYTHLYDENFYKTIDDAEMALIGCYDGYQDISASGDSFYLPTEIFSDAVYGGGGYSDGRGNQLIDRFDMGQNPSDTNLFQGQWTRSYAAIYRCNVLLAKLEGLDFGENTALRGRIEGETRFLRAIVYFDLVRAFENIPLLTVSSEEITPQAPVVDVYKQIVEDLNYAADNIPEDAYPRANGDVNDGRVTRWAAKAMLGRVYLFYNGYYGNEDLGLTKAQALQALEDVVVSGEFDLEDNYHQMWPGSSYKIDWDAYDPDAPLNSENKNPTDIIDKSDYIPTGKSKEAVFTLKFNSIQMHYGGDRNSNRWQVNLAPRNTPLPPYGKGWGSATVSAKFMDSFEPGDKRKAVAAIDFEGEGIADDFNGTLGRGDQREYTGYTIKKYAPSARPSGTSDTAGNNDFMEGPDHDFIVMRYADVLLMAAELGSPNAQTYFDRVRTRAGLDSKPVNQANILNERKYEFAFEGLRYWDLLRQGVEVAAATIAETTTVESGYVSDQVVISAQNIISKRGFMQIPSNQITISDGKLKQNVGW